MTDTADGLRLHWELHGGGSTTIVLLPPNPISHSRLWKAQIHFLARHHRVLAFDGRGNGRSDAPDPGQPWNPAWRRDDCRAVMDATGTDAAVLVGICVDGVWTAIQLAAEHPDRVQGVVALAAGAPLHPDHPHKAAALARFTQTDVAPEGWGRYNARYIREQHAAFLRWWFSELFPEPHSTRQLEDAVAYGLDGSPDVLAMVADATQEDPEATCRRVRCPVLVVHGDEDACQPLARSARLSELTGGELVRLAGVGHLPNARHPVLVNRLIDDFVGRLGAPRPGRRRTWTVASRRSERVLIVSSPIGLGHAWRDVAIARELRRRNPRLHVCWLAQSPVAELLRTCGEDVHPASAGLAAEAPRVDAAGGEHRLHAFELLRRLDDVFCANFMVFHDLVREEPFDAWIADEAWEVDHFLHENPELKTAPYVWLTDFVGVLPMAAGGLREATLTADRNAEMIDQVARSPRVRDRAIFIGDPEDVVPASFGPGLPTIRAWTERHLRCCGYVTVGAPTGLDDGGRAAIRAELGWRPEERVCVVTAGGSGVGGALLHRAAEARDAVRERIPGLRMVIVAGPRMSPDDLPTGDGLEVHGYVHRLDRWLAACDVAVTHGGLATTMELTAAGRPFVTVPLRDHFEQQIHVAHRVRRYGAGRRLDYEQTSPAALAGAIAERLAGTTTVRPVAAGGAARAASMIAELLPA